MPIMKRILTPAEKQARIAAGIAKREAREKQRRQAEQGILGAFQKARVNKVLKARSGKTATRINSMFENKIAAETAGFRRNRFVKRRQSKAKRREIELLWRKLKQAKNVKLK